MRMGSCEDVQFSLNADPSTCFTANFISHSENTRGNSIATSNFTSKQTKFSATSGFEESAAAWFEETPFQKIQMDYEELSKAPRKDPTKMSHFCELQYQTPATSNQQSRFKLENVLQVKESAEKENHRKPKARFQFDSQPLSQILSQN